MAIFKDIPIQKKLIRVIMLISGSVLILTCTAFFVYEFLTFREASLQQLSTIAKIVSDNSTAALAFNSPEDANEILASLKAESHIEAAGLYDKGGNLFSQYPLSLELKSFPVKPEQSGYRFCELTPGRVSTCNTRCREIRNIIFKIRSGSSL